MITEKILSAKIKRILSKHNTGPVSHYPYVQGVPDRFGQREPTFGTATPLVGRAILNPTEETISGIGNDMKYEIAFLFSKEELDDKFGVVDGERIKEEDQMSWRGARYRVVKVHPTGQIGQSFLMTAVMACSIEGKRAIHGTV